MAGLGLTPSGPLARAGQPSAPLSANKPAPQPASEDDGFVFDLSGDKKFTGKDALLFVLQGIANISAQASGRALPFTPENARKAQKDREEFELKKIRTISNAIKVIGSLPEDQQDSAVKSMDPDGKLG